MNPDRDLAIDQAKFEFLWPLAYPYYSKISPITKFVKKLVNDDILSFGQLFEKAIEKQLGLVRESTASKDFKNGDDAKCVVARVNSYGQRYSANVCNVHSKTGWLLVSVYERKQDKWYFFRIPHSAYKHIPKTSNIEIPFELDGSPKLSNHWWQHKVDSFKQLGGQ